MLQAVLLFGIGAAPWAATAPTELARPGTHSMPRTGDVSVEAATAARLREPGGPWRAARAGERLRPPVDVEIRQPAGELRLAYRGTRAELSGLTRAAVGLPSRSWAFWIETGRLQTRARRGEVVAITPRGTWRGAGFELAVGAERGVATAQSALRVEGEDAERSFEAGATIVATAEGLKRADLDRAPTPPEGPRADPETVEPETVDPPERRDADRPRRPTKRTRRTEQDRARSGPPRPAAVPSQVPEPASTSEAEGPGRRSRAHRPTEPPARLEVDWTKPGRPEENPLERMKREAPAPGEE